MLVSLLSFLVIGAVATSASPSVTLPNGSKITGKVETNVAGNDVHVFRGIPYAEPPVGERRWKQTTLKPVTGDVDATKYGSICYYVEMYHPPFAKLPPSEDCLFLNVFKPADTTRDSKLPVMVWIHGGAFVSGTSNTEEGTNLVAAAKEKAIVVNFNYRLGVFGFFSNAEILREGDGANFGLRDQEVAFQWVKQHIEFFGGDPEQITAFGESAGSMSVAMHMLARDGDQQLFQRAIMQSGGYTTVHDTATPEVQEQNTATIAKGVGCEGSKNMLECLRAADASSIFAAGGMLQWIATVDGVFMKEMPIQRLLAGKISRVPTIIGTNTDEGWVFTFETAQADKFEAHVRTRFSHLTEREYERVMDLYPASAFATPHHRAAEVFGDVIFVCPSEQLSDKLATLSIVETEVCADGACPSNVAETKSSAPTYHYRFNHVSYEFGHPLTIHAKDVPYVFNLERALPGDEETKTVVGYVQKYWTNFAISGSPNGDEEGTRSTTIPWPLYDTAKQQLVIQPELMIETNGKHLPGHPERCAFWNAVEKRVSEEVKFA